MYIKKVLSGVLVLVLLFSLSSCFAPRVLEFPVSETGFPIGFTRLSDGAQIYLGMTRDEVGRILVATNAQGERLVSTGSMVMYRSGREVAKSIGYIDDRAVYIVSISENWAIVGEISPRGDILQNIIDSGIFPNITPLSEPDAWEAFDNAENPIYALIFGFDSISERLMGITLKYWSE